MRDTIGRGVAFPLRVDAGGAVALVDDDEDIHEAVELILGTAPGERPMRPQFGCAVHDYVFETVDAYTVGRLERAVRIALDRWEPRIEVLAVDVDVSQAGRGLLPIEITYRLRATNDVRNLVYPFYVIPAEEPA
jgi:phage baseplate assembly protein W